MKKILSALLALTLIASFVPQIPMAAQAATSGHYTYTVANGEATITDYYIYGSGELVIPATLDGYKVTAIGNDAFANCEYLTGVTIPEGVISLGDGAFSGCSELKSVTIPQSVISMGDNVFSHCYRLSSVTLPENVDRIGDYAFCCCFDLKSITIPEGVTSIGEKAFGSSGLTSITLHEGLISIGDGAFSYSSLAAITIPESVTTIGAYAFQHCWIRSITIPSGVTSISDYAFAMCDELVDVKIPSTVTSIGKYAFYDCDKLATITIPEGVVSINDGTFSYCDSLTNISLPASLTGFGTRVFDGCPKLSNLQISENNKAFSADGAGVLFNKDKTELICVLNRSLSGTYSVPEGVTRIGDKAFSGCSSLTGIGIPKSLTDIGSNAFQGCTALTGFSVNAENAFFSNDGKGVLFNKDKTELLYAPIGKMTSSYTIPAGVTRIGDYAFSNCSNLTGITIPASVTSIGDNAFYYCSKLSKVTIPSGVTSIGSRAFSECKTLTSITIPDSVTSIGHYAFNFCTGLTSVKLPGNLTSISAGMFEGCYALSSITIPNSVTSIGAYAFHRSGLTGITIPDSVTDIGEYAFHMSALTSVTLPSSLTAIGDGVFRETDLTGITIPDSVTSIGNSAFAVCGALTSITIPNSVTQIGAGAFFLCEALTSVTIPGSVTSIGDSAFSSCYALTNITIPEGVTHIGNKAFYYCEKLTNISIPNSITGMGENVFEGADKLVYYTYDGSKYLGNSGNQQLVLVKAYAGETSYQIPKATKIIMDQAFLNCKSLTAITIPVGVTQIGKGAFNGCTALKSIQVSGNNAYYSQGAQGELFNKEETELIKVPVAGISGGYTVADGVTTIADYAFSECTTLTGIVIPTSVVAVGMNAFENCDNLLHVWYSGSEDHRTNITVATGNEYFENTTWHYNCCKPDSHIYDNACDMACNTCGYIRTVPDHIYTNSCDTSCNICGYIRSITHTYDHGCDTICNVCGEVRTVAGHVYTHSCDKTCNNCGYQRETTHIYDNADDLTCNVCKESLAPCAPTLLTNEPDTITLQPQAGLEYSRDGISWQTSNVFTGLSHLTAYTFYQRVARSEDAAVSPASPGLTVTTVDKYIPDMPKDITFVEVTETSVTLNQVAGCEYSINGRNWQTSPVFTGLMPGVEYTFYQRSAENSKYYQSDSSAVLHVTTHSSLGTITYNANGGEDAPGTTVGKISAQKPTREGYHFMGWALTPDTYAVYNPEDVYNHQEDIVLYASWRKLCDNCGGKEEYFVACYACSGTGLGDSESCFSCMGKGYIFEEETCPVGNCYGGSLILNGAYFGKCSSCGGDGIWEKPVDCFNCGGAGELHYVCGKCHGYKGSWYPCTKCVSGVQKFTPEAPQAPQLQSVSNHTVVLVSYPNCQYRVGGGSWQDSNVFTNLEEDREYTFYQRYKSTTYTYDSSSSPALRVTTEASPYNKQYTVEFRNWDGSVISSGIYRYEDPVQVPPNPTRPADEDISYTFIGWDKEITPCLGDVVYTAVFQADCIPGDYDDNKEVTDADAIYLLRHTLFPNVYTLNQSGDTNADGEISDADAIYLLRHTLFPAVYPLFQKK